MRIGYHFANAGLNLRSDEPVVAVAEVVASIVAALQADGWAVVMHRDGRAWGALASKGNERAVVYPDGATVYGAVDRLVIESPEYDHD